MSRNDQTQALLNIRGVGIVEAVTLIGLSRIIGKSRTSILRYEKSGVFPDAPILLGSIRYYPVSLARRLVPLVAKLPPHKKPDAELVVEINKLFKEERNKLCQK